MGKTTRRITAAVLVSYGLVTMSAPASAVTPALTSTSTTKGAVSSFHQVDPCLGGVSMTLTYNSVIHSTELVSGPNAGTTHLAFAQQGTFVLDPDEPALPSYVGIFSIKGGFNATPSTVSSTVTSTSVGRASDGSRIRLHLVSHVLVTPEGVEMSFSFETTDCPV